MVQLLVIVRRLEQAYPGKELTLGGRLVGDVGEMLALSEYVPSAYDRLTKHLDTGTPDRQRVQNKATMNNSLPFPADHVLYG